MDLVVRVDAGGSDRTCDHGCLERREIAGVGAEVAHLEDSITAHLEEGQMFGARERGPRSNTGANRVVSFGIVKVANYVARPYLESGQLMQVLTDWTAEQFPISVMYPRSRHLSAKVRIFVDWVSELIQQDPIFQTR
jgi:DNA-binding transcriptional LysR family regulator